MPVGIVGIIVLAVATVMGVAYEDLATERNDADLRARYQVSDDYDAGNGAQWDPSIREIESSPAPAVHPAADAHGIIPAAGDPWPSRPSIIDE
jgi:hypothetical protein